MSAARLIFASVRSRLNRRTSGSFEGGSCAGAAEVGCRDCGLSSSRYLLTAPYAFSATDLAPRATL